MGTANCRDSACRCQLCPLSSVLSSCTALACARARISRVATYVLPFVFEEILEVL